MDAGIFFCVEALLFCLWRCLGFCIVFRVLFSRFWRGVLCCFA